MPGEGQEHVVERRTAQRDVDEGDPGIVELAHRGDQRVGAVGDGHGHAIRAAVDGGVLAPDQRQGSGRPFERVRLGDRDVEDVTGELVLELERRAVGDDGAVVDDHDVVGELVGFLEVLRGEQQRGAVVHEIAEVRPELDAATGVEPGGRLVEQQHARARHETGAEVEPAGHAARVGLHRAVGSVVQRQPVEGLVGAHASFLRTQA